MTQRPPKEEESGINPLRDFFDKKTAGPEIWKWEHYFDFYHHRRFQRFRGRDLHVLEIGVYNGGSFDISRLESYSCEFSRT